MARKKEKTKDYESSWLDTYADTITLLLTFFVLLYSISSVDSEKVKQISNSFNKVFTGDTADSILEYNLYNGTVPVVGGESKDDIDKIDNKGDRKTYREAKEFIESNDLDEYVDISSEDNNTILNLKDTILFDTGKAELKADSLAILDKITTLISNLPNKIVVEGHTDNVPISTAEFQSNWELSAARASKVVRYFTETKGMQKGRFSAIGYSDNKPLVPNTSDENKSKNRRVNIVIQSSSEE